MSTADVARERGVSTRTVHRMVFRQILVPFVEGPGPTGAYLFRREDVEKAFAERSAA